MIVPLALLRHSLVLVFVGLRLKTCSLTTKLGSQKASALVRSSAGASPHSSLPCTPWSTWNHMNLHKLGHYVVIKLAKKRAESLQMLTYFFLLAREITALGGDVSFEWPRFCTGWDLDVLKKFIATY